MAGLASILEVLITADATSLKAGMAQATVATEQFAATTKTASGTTAAATKSVSTLGKIAKIGYGAAALGAAYFAKESLDAAVAFNRAFTQISALTNTSDKRVEELKGTVMSLAGETAQSPVDLAHAMYFLASAGLSASQQMDALDATAHGMAVGLGEAGDLARITANALNTFGDNGLKATDVMDTLAAAIREGTAEPDEFAGALGRVLPIADNAGISFQQVAASLATMSNAGLDVNEGVTALRAILQSLNAPTAQTVAAFNRIGISVDDVIESMQGDGLIATLRMVSAEAHKTATSQGDYNMLMRKLIPNIRGLAGAFNLTGQEADKVDKIFKAIAHSSGDLGEAFATTAESDAFKMQKALNDMAIEGQKLAADVLPVIARGLSLVADNAKELFTILAGYVVLRTASKGLTAWAGDSAAIAGRLTASGKAAAFLSGNLGTVGLAAGGAYLAFNVLNGAIQDANINFEELQKQTKISIPNLKEFRDQMDFKGGLFDANSMDGVIASLNGGKDNLDELLGKLGPTIGAMQDMGVSADAQALILHKWNENLDGSSDAIDDYVLNTGNLVKTIHDTAQAYTTGEISAKSYYASMQYLLQNIPGAEQDAFRIANIMLDAHGERLKKTGEIVRNFGGLTSEELQKLSGEYVSQFNVIDGALEKFAGKNNLTADKVIASFQKQLDAIHNYENNVETLKQRNIPDDVAMQIADMGIDGAGFVDMLANATKEDFNTIITQMHKGAGAAVDVTDAWTHIPKEVSTKYTVKTAGDIAGKTIEKIKGDITNMTGQFRLQKEIRAQVSVPIEVVPKADQSQKIKVTADTTDANSKIAATKGNLQDITAHTWKVNADANTARANEEIAATKNHLEDITSHGWWVNVWVHTGTRSPWPDEALKQHLTDPLLKMGAKKINGVWTVPLTVGVHTAVSSLAIQKAMAAAPKGFAMAKDAVGADKYAKLMKAIKDDAHKTGELHLKALRKIIADEASPKRAREWAAAAVEAFNQRMQQAQEPPAWIAHSGHNVPRLPRGVGRHEFPVEHHGGHKREINIKLDRKHYADSMTQEVSYGRGY